MEIDILREPYVSQTADSNSCGAHSIAYYLWETDKSEFVNDKNFVANIHKNIEVGPNLIDIPENYSSPNMMAEELKKNWQTVASACMLPNSPLVPIYQALNFITENKDVISEVKTGASKYVIIMCSLGMSWALHYMLVKYENSKFKLLDSLYSLDNVVWEDFSLEINGKLTLDRESDYYYSGAGILIK